MVNRSCWSIAEVLSFILVMFSVSFQAQATPITTQEPIEPIQIRSGINASANCGAGQRVGCWLATDNQQGSNTDWTQLNYNVDTWGAVYPNYPNDITSPNDIYVNAPGGYGTGTANLMWYWPYTTKPDGKSGPSEVYFRYEFDLSFPVGNKADFKALVIADDYFYMYLNGNKVTSAWLEDNLKNNQPEPITLDLGDSYLHDGTNVLAIYAKDGYQTGELNQLYEWLFFDGQIVAIPVPATISLFALGLIVLVFFVSRGEQRCF